MRWAATVLAAGQGTRMRSTRPKVLHELAERPLIDHVLDTAQAVAEAVVVVVGHGAPAVVERISDRGVGSVLQEPQLGTGDALRVALRAIDDELVDGVVVLSGDVPLLAEGTVRQLMARVEEGAAAALLSAELEDPAAYGRVLRDGDGRVRAIVEASDARPDELAVREVNAGVYAFALDPVSSALEHLAPENAQGEYYLTDVVAAIREQGLAVDGVLLGDPVEMHGVNTRLDLARVAAVVNRRRLSELMLSGVTVVDPASTWVGPRAVVEADVILEPGVVLRGACRIGEGAHIGAHAVLHGAVVEAGETVPPLTAKDGR